MSSFNFSGWFSQVPNLFTGRTYTFSNRSDSISVRQEGSLAHSCADNSRARCIDTGVEFDLRRLRLGAESGGLVTLEALEALERESCIATHAGSHINIARCYGTLVENQGTEHCRLLLCDPCSMDLAAHLRSSGGELGAHVVAELGEQLALGLRHLHSVEILCGSVTAQGVLLGHDGKWKLLGQPAAAAELPCSIEKWRQRFLETAKSNSVAHSLPPEARTSSREAPAKEKHEVSNSLVSLTLDIWMLGALLAEVLAGIDARGIGGARDGNAVLATTEEVLLCPLASRLWMLLHWLLATEPWQRPWSRRLVDIMHSLTQWWPQDLLIEMPEYARFHCQGMAAASARRLCFAGIAAQEGMNRSCVAGLPLEVLRRSLSDTSFVDQLCENCGLEPAEENILIAQQKDATAPAPSLLKVQAAPPLVINAPTESLCSSKHGSPGGFHTDESTDEGSASGDDSTQDGDRGSGSRRRLSSWSTTKWSDDEVDCVTHISAGCPKARQRRPITSK